MADNIIKNLCENNRQSICTHTSMQGKFLNKTSRAERTEIPVALQHGAGVRTSGLHFQHRHNSVQSSYCCSPDGKTSSFSSQVSEGEFTTLGAVNEHQKSLHKVVIPLLLRVGCLTTAGGAEHLYGPLEHQIRKHSLQCASYS